MDINHALLNSYLYLFSLSTKFASQLKLKQCESLDIFPRNHLLINICIELSYKVAPDIVKFWRKISKNFSQENILLLLFSINYWLTNEEVSFSKIAKPCKIPCCGIFTDHFPCVIFFPIYQQLFRVERKENLESEKFCSSPKLSLIDYTNLGH